MMHLKFYKKKRKNYRFNQNTTVLQMNYILKINDLQFQQVYWNGVAVAIFRFKNAKNGVPALFLAAYTEFAERYFPCYSVTRCNSIVTQPYSSKGNTVVTRFINMRFVLHLCYNLLHQLHLLKKHRCIEV